MIQTIIDMANGNEGLIALVVALASGLVWLVQYLKKSTKTYFPSCTLTVGNDYEKSFDWDAMNRLHEKALIESPLGKAKSILFTEKGLKESERLFHEMFTKGS